MGNMTLPVGQKARIQVQDSQAFVRSMDALSTDIIFCDPPYGLGSEVIIRPDGKPDYSKAADFMSKWDMPTGTYWESWFKEAYRTLKRGGYCVMYGMDRQLLLFKYYAALAGFSERQSLYWYFISNFPKASDLSKNLDKNAGAEREVVGKSNRHNSVAKSEIINPQGDGGVPDITAPSSPLAKKYDGYKYSVSPLKQTNETIMVFQKPYKTGSCLHDTLAYEAGDKTCCCGALAINQNRCPTTDTYKYKRKGGNSGNVAWSGLNVEVPASSNDAGRYPAQTFVSPEAGEVLDRQSGISKATLDRSIHAGKDGTSYFAGNKQVERTQFGDVGGCSKILHKCPYEEGEMDLYMYCPKVGKQERNAGVVSEAKPQHRNGAGIGEGEHPEAPAFDRNFHPTLKPISLNTRILRLFKTPNPQRILIPFCGSGSEIIGAIKAGFTDWDACEINPEYAAIAEARIEHWSKEKAAQPTLL